MWYTQRSTDDCANVPCFGTTIVAWNQRFYKWILRLNDKVTKLESLKVEVSSLIL